MKKKVAIFDIDGTIFRSSLLIELVESLVEEGIFPNTAIKEYENKKIKWLDRESDYESYIRAVVETFMKHIRGVPFSDFDRVAKAVAAKYKNRTYRYTRDLVQTLKKKNYYLLAISHSPKGIVESFGKALGFDKVYGIFYELGPTERFTGNIIDLHLIMNKAAILKRAVLKENLTLTGSIGVGDTESDIPLLEGVEHPICFNPNEKLYKYAKRQGWDVVVERKDVVYKINKL